MPRIREYISQSSAQADVPGRRASVSDFATTAGNEGQGLISAGETIMKTVERQEISDVDAKLAKARAEWTVHLQERAASSEPGDMSFASKFNTDFTSYLSQLEEGVQTAAGKRAFRRGAAELGAHFTERAGLYQIQSAGAKAKQDYLSALDSNRNALLNDPTQFESISRMMDASLDDPDGPYARMPATTREELRRSTRKDLALSAVQGVIRFEPELGLKQIKEGRWDQYLDADKKFALEKSAEVAIRAKEVEAERIARANEKAKEKEREATGNAFVAKLITDPTSLTAEDIVNSPLEWREKLHFNNMRQTALKPEPIRTDPAVMLDAWDRIHLPDGDPRKITKEEEVEKLFGQITISDVNALRSEIQGRRTDEGRIESDMKTGLLRTAKTMLSGTNQLTGLRDPKGDEQYQKFLVQFLPEYAKQRQAGKTPQQLLDPDSPDYLGKMADRFRRPPAQFMRDLLTENGSLVPGGGIAPALGAVPAPPTGP